ncbi:MAG: hypothetical protein LBL83_05525 [Clostridiales bacterium]|jgi:hypothetical protein|nr:hypothetical protein [Clostridiales bacterium]
MFKITASESKGWEIADGCLFLRCSDESGKIGGLECAGGKPVFKAEEIDMESDRESDKKTAYAGDCSFKVAYASASGDWAMSDEIKEIANGFYEVERSWRNLSGSPREAVLFFEMHTSLNPDFYLVPCVNYNGNKYGSGREPKGLLHGGRPWVFPYSRVGVPSAAFSEDSKYSVGVFVSAADEKSLVSACSMENSKDGMIYRLFWPDIERPVSYSGKDLYSPPIENTIKMRPFDEFRATFYISANPVIDKNAGWTKTYDRVSDLNRIKAKPLFSPQEVWEYGIAFAKQSLFSDFGDSGLFEKGLLPESETAPANKSKTLETLETLEPLKTSWKHRRTVRYEIGWCGQNASLAQALINDFLISGNNESLSIGVKVLDTWERRARIGNGLFYARLADDIEGGKPSAEADACNLGWGAWQMMDAWLLAKEAGIDKPLWLDMGMKLCDFFIAHYDDEAIFGKTWTAGGICTDKTGTIGAFILLPMLKAYEISKDIKYLECSVKAFNAYAARDLDKMECSAGALDTCCVDKETCWPLLKAALDLYETTGEDHFLKSALKAGYYLLSWMYHYDVLSDAGSDFSQYGYRTCGATAVSTQHHHLDPWGGLICGDWLRLYRITGDERWKTRALATWGNSLLCISDGSLKIHGATRPKGSQNEAYFHCMWAFGENDKISRGNMNDWLVAWPCAFRLITLMREKQWEIFK